MNKLKSIRRLLPKSRSSYGNLDDDTNGNMNSGLELQTRPKSGWGKDYDMSGNLRYEGNFENGVYNGQGTLHGDTSAGMTANDRYEGEFLDGKMHGKGKYYFQAGSYYSGDLKDGHFNGKGDIYTKNHIIKMNGEWVNDFKHGKFTLYHTTNDKRSVLFTGHYRNGKVVGYGMQYNEDGTKRYDGTFIDGMYDGDNCTYYSTHGTIKYKGDFRKNNYHGKGICYDDLGDEIVSGTFQNGLLVD
jgi:hypothetical protein